MPLTTAGRNTLLTGGWVGSANTDFLALHTADPTAGNELTGGSPAYARKAVVWTAAASGQTTTNAAITFDVAAGTTVVFASVFDAVTTGTLQAYSGIGTTLVQGVGSATASSDLIQSKGHGLTTDNRVFFWPGGDAALPAGISAAVAYWVIATGLTTDVFSVSTTQGGAALNITADGEMAWQQTKPEVFGSQGTLTIPINTGIVDATFA